MFDSLARVDFDDLKDIDHCFGTYLCVARTAQGVFTCSGSGTGTYQTLAGIGLVARFDRGYKPWIKRTHRELRKLGVLDDGRKYSFIHSQMSSPNLSPSSL